MSVGTVKENEELNALLDKLSASIHPVVVPVNLITAILGRIKDEVTQIETYVSIESVGVEEIGLYPVTLSQKTHLYWLEVYTSLLNMAISSKPNNITVAFLGRNHEDDAYPNLLERLNCLSTDIGHERCGWCYLHDCPKCSCKMCG